jgi:hypothetical protein
MCGCQRGLAAKTFTALERLLDTDDLIIVNRGVEKVIWITMQGFMHDPCGPRALPTAAPALPGASDLARPQTPGLPLQ